METDKLLLYKNCHVRYSRQKEGIFMANKSVNIAQNARITSVHPSTVSRALYSSQLVKPETRKWIQCLAQKNDYIPDVLAQSLI